MLAGLYQEFSPPHVTNSPVLVLLLLCEIFMGHKSLVEVKGAIEIKGYFFSEFSGCMYQSAKTYIFNRDDHEGFDKIEFH